MNATTTAERAMSNRFPDFFSNAQKDIDLAMGFQRLAEDFYLGRGREPDLEQAKLCLRNAAQYGVGDIRAEALCGLALLVEDPQIKLLLYMEAVNENSAYAMNMVGVCIERYGMCEGRAEEWYKRAAEAGSPEGKHNLEQWNKRHMAQEAAAKAEAQARSRRLHRFSPEAEKRGNRLKKFFDSNLETPAETWCGDPAAILYTPEFPAHHKFDDPIDFIEELKELTYYTAEKLNQSVLLLTDFDPERWWHQSPPFPMPEYDAFDSMLIAVGYDHSRVGLLQAMNRTLYTPPFQTKPELTPRYQVKDNRALIFAVTGIHKYHLNKYCAEVKKFLKT